MLMKILAKLMSSFLRLTFSKCCDISDVKRSFFLRFVVGFHEHVYNNSCGEKLNANENSKTPRINKGLPPMSFPKILSANK